METNIILLIIDSFRSDKFFNSNFSYTIFQTVSLLTGTGFTTTNYVLWPKMSIFGQKNSQKRRGVSVKGVICREWNIN